LKSRFICLTLALIFWRPNSEAQWVQCDGPYGGDIRSIVVAPNVGGADTNLFAANYGHGVFRSTDNGANWTSVNTGLTSPKVLTLLASDTNLFVGTQDSGVFRSTDGGRSWTAANAGLENLFIKALAVSPQWKGVTKLFAAAWDAGNTYGYIYFSTDNGRSWTLVNLGLECREVCCFAVSPSSDGAAPPIIFAGNDGAGVYRSTDNGASWTHIVNDDLASVAGLAFSGTNLIVSTYSYGVFLSTDNGTSWTRVISWERSLWNTSVAASGPDAFVGSQEHGVFHSTDNGASWTSANVGLTLAPVQCLAVSGVNVYAGTWGAGAFGSTNMGAKWSAVSRGLSMAHVYALAAKDSSLFIGTDGGVLLSTNRGASWTPVNAGLWNTVVHALVVAQDGMSLFAGTAQGFFRSTDNGTSWSGGDRRAIWSLAVAGPNIYAGLDSYGAVIQHSTNNGTDWTLTWIQGSSIRAVAISGTDVFAGCAPQEVGPNIWVGGGIYRSTDEGTSWTTMNTGLVDSSISVLAVSGTTLYAGTNGGRTYLSRNNGTSWTAATIPLTNLALNGPGITALTFIEGRLIAGTNGSGIFVSTLDGTNWTSFSVGLGNTFVNSLLLDGTDLFVGTEGGVWRRSWSELVTSAASPSCQLPSTSVLHQNYPNPFNPSTTIKFELPKASHVNLSVFDVLGRQVSVLVNERRDAGVHEVKFDGSNLASGVYFYRLQAGDFVKTRQLMVLK
jgi:hypothetical protein